MYLPSPFAAGSSLLHPMQSFRICRSSTDPDVPCPGKGRNATSKDKLDEADNAIMSALAGTKLDEIMRAYPHLDGDEYAYGGEFYKMLCWPELPKPTNDDDYEWFCGTTKSYHLSTSDFARL